MLVILGNPKFGTNLRVFGWDKMPTVYGEKGSTVEAYCKKMGADFIAIDRD